MSDARVILFGAGVGLVLVFAVAAIGRRALAAADLSLQAINPANPNNAIAGAVNGLGETITGTPSWSLGGWVWELSHPGQRQAEREVTGGGGGGASGAW